MARGQEIIVSSEPRGVFDEGVIDDTSKPGTLMEMVPNAAFVGGRPTWRASSHAAGAKGPVVVLLPDQLQGKTATDAYVAGTRCFLYWPVAGENLNLLLGDVAGTGDIVTQGDLFGSTTTGKIIRNSSYTSAPFQAMESLAAATADALVWVKYLGNQA
jgi:hypothetical protein